jgi:hypothetical protein
MVLYSLYNKYGNRYYELKRDERMNLNFYEIGTDLVNLDTVTIIQKGEDLEEENKFILLVQFNDLEVKHYVFPKKIERDRIYNEIMMMSRREIRTLDRQ